MLHAKTIAIVVVGFAGTTLARALDGKLPPDYQLLIISEESHTTFNPMLPEAVAASIFPEQVVAPIRQMLTRGRFVMGRVTTVHLARRAFTASTLAGEVTLPYEHLVLAFGNRARLELIPGLAEHALPLKTVGDAMHIRNMVLRRVAQIELEHDPELRIRLGYFVVIGGGFSGVETAGELVDCLANIRRYYPRVAREELQVTYHYPDCRPGCCGAPTTFRRCQPWVVRCESSWSGRGGFSSRTTSRIYVSSEATSSTNRVSRHS